MLASGTASSDVAKELGLPVGTVSSWLCKWKDNPEFQKLQKEKKDVFAEKAKEICDLGQTLLIRRLQRALECEDEIDELIDIVKTASSLELNGPARQGVLSKLREIKVDDIKSIGVTVGTMFDKKQLADGKPTENVGITRFEDLLDNVINHRTTN